MGAFRDFARSLKPGNDRQLAATQYAGRESGSDRAARRRRERYRSNVTKDARKAQDREERYWRNL